MRVFHTVMATLWIVLAILFYIASRDTSISETEALSMEIWGIGSFILSNTNSILAKLYENKGD